MTYDAQGLREIVRAGENDHVELKSRVRDPDVLARLISAFANTDGGLIIVGVDERDRRFTGVDVVELQAMLKAALSRLESIPDARLSLIDGLAERPVGVIHVSPHGGPVLSRGGAYFREGTATKPMSAPALAHALNKEPI